MLPEAHAKRAINLLKASGDNGLSVAVCFSLMYWHGLRFGDAARIKRDDVEQYPDKTLIKFKAKRGRTASIRVHEAFHPVLLEYLASELSLSPHSELLVRSDGGLIYYNLVSREVKRIFGSRFVLHDFRRGWAQNKHELGGSDMLISSGLNHGGLSTLAKYVHRSDETIIRDFYNGDKKAVLNYAVSSAFKAGDFLHFEKCLSIFREIKNDRDALLFVLVAFCGVKTSELGGLKRSDFKKNKQLLKIDSRIIPLEDWVCEVLFAYIDDLCPSDFLFLKMKKTTALSAIRRVNKQVGCYVNGKLLHSSYIVRQLNRGVNPLTLAQMMNCTVENVARYIGCAHELKS